MIALNVNGAALRLDADPDTPLLWALRDHLELTGTKFACGVGACGACTVHLDDAPVRSCVMPVGGCEGKRVTTIEGLGQTGAMHAVQQAWLDHQVPQCGYCQTGMIMAAAALLKANPHPTESDIAGAMTNLCRCGTYPRVRRALLALAAAPAAPKA